jgi:hypothetical protein
MIETAREGHPLAPKFYRTKTFLVEREKDEGLTSIRTCRKKDIL